MTVEEAQKYVEEGQFAPGSMLPKVQAAMDFASSGEGRTAMITLLEKPKTVFRARPGLKSIFKYQCHDIKSSIIWSKTDYTTFSLLALAGSWQSL